MTATTTPGPSSSKSLWKRIFKHKKSLSESSRGDRVVVDSKDDADPSGSRQSASESPEDEEEDAFPVFEFGASSAEFANALSTPRNNAAHLVAKSSLALPNMTHKRTSKATICTASTAFSTVNTSATPGSASPSFTLATTPGRKGHVSHGAPPQLAFKTSASQADEFSYSCAASTAWTGNVTPTTTPSPGKNRAVTSSVSSAVRGTPMLPLADKHARNGGVGWASLGSAGAGMGADSEKEATVAPSDEKDQGKKETVGHDDEDKEEKDGFVELITERQMSRRYASVSENLTNLDTAPQSAPAPAQGGNKPSNSNGEAIQEVVSQGYRVQGYDLSAFHQNNPFQTNISRSAQAKEGVQSRIQAKQGDSSKQTTTNTTAVIETKRSESPDEPPNTQRKTVHPEFFMEEQPLPPSPTSKHRKQQQQQKQSVKDHQQKAILHHQQQAQHSNDYDDNPNHLYAEINIKQRPHPVTRQGSEGTASLAMTSISSLTGHGSLFAKDNSFDNGGLSPLPGGFWRIGSTIVKPASDAAEQENYFDYSNDDTLKRHRSRENSEGMIDRLANILNQLFYTTCQCFELNSGSAPMSPAVTKRESNNASVVDTKTLNETTVNGTTNAVITVTTQGGNTVGNKSEPTFSVPMEN